MIRKLSLATFAAFAGLAAMAVAGTTAQAQSANKQVTLSGNITANKKLLKKNQYILDGGVFIKEGATLRIEPGTQIFGKPGSFLVIDKGGKIMAKGKANKPIVFTSAQPVGQRARGDWGGLIFNGNAPVNCAGTAGGTCEGEGGTGAYGGTNAADNQGILQYVRVEFGGFAISPDNELNCIAFQGVGNGTVIDHVEGLYGGDDAFEFFGGTVNAKYLVAVGAIDDNFDWTFGYSGKIQFGVIQQRADGPSVADRGFEADNNESNNNVEPRSNPQIANVTIVGDPDPAFAGSSQGMELRRGTAGQIRNIIVMGFKKEGIRISDQATYDQYAAGNLDLQGIILFNNKGGDNLSGTTEAAIAGKGLLGLKILDQVDPLLPSPFDKTAPNFRPAAGSPALSAANVAPKFSDAFFVDAPFVGGFDGTTDWTAGWVSWASR